MRWIGFDEQKAKRVATQIGERISDFAEFSHSDVKMLTESLDYPVEKVPERFGPLNDWQGWKSWESLRGLPSAYPSTLSIATQNSS
jgi:hypothetical protein